MSKEYSEHQPKDGDIVIGCGHMTESGHAPYHFFAMDGCVLATPSGRHIAPTHFVVCDGCLRAAGYMMERVPVTEHGTWHGNDPIVEVQPDPRLRGLN
mgnify:CR=1 FL=1